MSIYKKYAIYYFIGFVLTLLSWLSIVIYIAVTKLTPFVLVNLIIVTLCLVFFITCSVYYRKKAKRGSDNEV